MALQHILQAAASDGAQRNAVVQRTVQAAMAAGTLALMPGLAGVAAEAVAFGKNPVGYCLSSPAACTVAVEAVGCTAAISDCAKQLIDTYALPHSMQLGDALIAANALEHKLTESGARPG